MLMIYSQKHTASREEIPISSMNLQAPGLYGYQSHAKELAAHDATNRMFRQQRKALR